VQKRLPEREKVKWEEYARLNQVERHSERLVSRNSSAALDGHQPMYQEPCPIYLLDRLAGVWSQSTLLGHLPKLR